MDFSAACGLGIYVCSSDWCGLNLSSRILQELGTEGWQKAGVVVVVVMVDEVGRGGGIMDLWESGPGSGKVQLTDRSLTCSSNWYSLHLGSGTCLCVILTCCSDNDL